MTEDEGKVIEGNFDAREAKVRRMITGGVVGATALILTLLVVFVWQIVTICVQNKRKAELEAEAARLEQLLKDGEESVAFYASEEGLKYLAFQQGFLANNGK